MKTGSQGKDSSQCFPLPEDHEFYLEHCNRIQKALDLIQSYLPDYYFLISLFFHKIILVDDKASFRGATSYYARGLAYFRPRPTWDFFVWAEELVHEATHNQVHSLLTFDELVTGGNRLTRDIPGPLRHDLRHHFGNFQSLHVISRLLKLNETLIKEGYDPIRLKDRNADLRKKCKTPYKRLAVEAQFTEVGQTIFREEILPAFTH